MSSASLFAPLAAGDWPAYKQRELGAASRPALLILASTCAVTAACACLEAYLMARQRKAVAVTTLPPALLASLQELSHDEAAALLSALKKKENEREQAAHAGDGGSAAAVTTATVPPHGHVQEDQREAPRPDAAGGAPEQPTTGGDAKAALRAHLNTHVRKSSAYTRDKLRHAITKNLFMTVFSVMALVGGVLPAMYDLAHLLLWSGQKRLGMGLRPDSEIQLACAFVSIYSLLNTLIELPFNYVSTFVVEQRYGFNKQTVGGFVKDLVLMNVVKAVIGLPIVAALVAIMNFGGTRFYMYAMPFIVCVQLLAMVIYPNFIAPLFNKFAPMEDGALRTQIYALAERQRFPLTQLYVIDGSRRSAHSNAYFFGFGRHKRIVLYDTLLQHASNEEIVAVLAHEIGHWQMSHTVYGILLSFSMTLCVLFSFTYFMSWSTMYHAFGFSEQPALVGLLLFSSVAVDPLGPLLSLAVSALSRRFEYQADAYAHKLGVSGALQKGLVKLHLHNLSALVVDPWYSAYAYSHPSLPERLRALQALDHKSQ